MRELKEEQEQVRNDYEAANRVNDWNRAAELRYGRMAEIEKQLESADKELETIKSGSALLKEEIDEEDIAKIVAKWTGIPVAKMLESEAEKLLKMEERLTARVVGQEEAVRAVSRAARLG